MWVSDFFPAARTYIAYGFPMRVPWKLFGPNSNGGLDKTQNELHYLK
jgi:hypothetical protein